MDPIRSIHLPEWPADLPRRVMESGSPGDTGRAGATEPREPSEAEPGLQPGVPFLLAGDRAAVRGQPWTGIGEIRIHPHAVAREFHVQFQEGRGFQADRPEARRVEVAPGAARRHLVMDGYSIIESILALQRLPGVVVQWGCPALADASDGSPEPGGRPTEIEVGWSLPPGVSAQLPDGAGGPLLILPTGVGGGSTSGVGVQPGSGGAPGAERDRTDDVGVRVELLGAEASWEIHVPGSPPGTLQIRPHDQSALEDRSRIGLHASLDIEGPLTLLFARDSGDRIQRAAILRRVGSLESELVARARSDARAAETELSLSTDDPKENEAFLWMRRRLHGVVGHEEGGGTVLLHPDGGEWTHRDVATVGTDLLALGRHEEAREIVDRATDLLIAGSPGRISGSNAPNEPGGPDDFVGSHASDDPSALLLLVARYTLWTGDAEPLGRLSGHVEDWLVRADGARREDTGAAGAHPQGARLDEVDPEGIHPAETGSISPPLLLAGAEWAEALEAAGERERADLIRELLDSFETPEEGRAGPVRSTAREASLSPAHLLLELLGARADAFFGRLRLAPRIPRSRTRLTVDGIRMGSSRMCLSYHAVDSRHTFRLEPTEGRVPMNLVFEPLLPGPAPGRTWVDGEPADVDPYRRGNRMGIRLQLPLDAPREVVVEEDTEESEMKE